MKAGGTAVTLLWGWGNADWNGREGIRNTLKGTSSLTILAG